MERIWHKMYGTGIPTEIDTSRYASVDHLFQDAVEQYADLPAFVGLGGELTYREVERLSCQFASYLQAELGITKGDRVALMSPNILAFPVAMSWSTCNTPGARPASPRGQRSPMAT
jgi:long-chain acyl-CoA synthetase